jgi:hypothetical protein
MRRLRTRSNESNKRNGMEKAQSLKEIQNRKRKTTFNLTKDTLRRLTKYWAHCKAHPENVYVTKTHIVEEAIRDYLNKWDK